MHRDGVEGSNYRSILAIVDVFSRFAFLYHLRNKSAICILEALTLTFTKHGYPKSVQCDKGHEFWGQLPKLLSLSGVKVITNRLYFPQSQGKMERANS